MFLTFKQKLKLTPQQIDILHKTSEEARVLYNTLLQNKNDYYEKTGQHLSYFKQQGTLKDYTTQYLTFDMKKEVCRLLDNNFKAYYNLLKFGKIPHVKAPRFRGKNYFFTLSYAQDFCIKDNVLQLSNKFCKFIKIPIKHNFNEQDTKNYNKTKSILNDCKIVKKGDDFFCCISYKLPDRTEHVTNNIISIDLGKKNLVTYYDECTKKACTINSDLFYENQKYFDKRIDKLNTKLHKKQKASIKYNKLKKKQHKLYNKRKQQVMLALHKLSKELCTKERDILIGDLTNLKRNTLSQYKTLNRQMQNNWPLMIFIDHLQYKCKKYGRKLIKINEAWTSKTCYYCGSINDGLTPSIRTYKCDSCGITVDRDVNGALNILKVYRTALGDYSTPHLEQSNNMFFGDYQKMNKFSLVL